MYLKKGREIENCFTYLVTAWIRNHRFSRVYFSNYLQRLPDRNIKRQIKPKTLLLCEGQKRKQYRTQETTRSNWWASSMRGENSEGDEIDKTNKESFAFSVFSVSTSFPQGHYAGDSSSNKTYIVTWSNFQLSFEIDLAFGCDQSKISHHLFNRSDANQNQ